MKLEGSLLYLPEPKTTLYSEVVKFSASTVVSPSVQTLFNYKFILNLDLGKQTEGMRAASVLFTTVCT
jgi:hypothetical protein